MPAVVTWPPPLQLNERITVSDVPQVVGCEVSDVTDYLMALVPRPQRTQRNKNVSCALARSVVIFPKSQARRDTDVLRGQENVGKMAA
jgi:hypothetical protein